MNKIDNFNFFNNTSLYVAKALIGWKLCRKINDELIEDVIIETEAYGGEKDLASAARNGISKHNEPIYGKAGKWYIYIIYGMHAMLNIVTCQKGIPSSVFIRSVKNCKGPGRLTKKFNITSKLNNTDCCKATGLWLSPPTEKYKIFKTARIGVEYAGTILAKKKLRFIAKDFFKKNYYF